MLIFFENRDLPVIVRTKNRDTRKLFLMYLLEKTTHPKVMKLGLYLPWMNIYRFDVGIEKFYFFRI